ncbi:MAG: ABC transporter substrate-binding protein, partial [Xanthobacteraceae bacterium]
MKRREFIRLLGGAAAWQLAARAQQPAMPVVGFLRSGTLTDVPHRVTAFHQGMKETGYVEGQNVAIEYRSDEHQIDRLPLLVADLLRRQVTLIVGNTPAALAAKAATTTVPILFMTGVDAVRTGLVASLNRPGGNVTGVSFMSVELGAKQLGLLRELRPGATRIAVLVDPKWPLNELFVSEVQAAASAGGQQLIVLDVSSDREIETAFTTLVQRGAGALLWGTGGFLLSRRERVVALAARHRIPAIYSWREAVAAGGLMSYAPSNTDAYRQAGIYAGR